MAVVDQTFVGVIANRLDWKAESRVMFSAVRDWAKMGNSLAHNYLNAR